MVPLKIFWHLHYRWKFSLIISVAMHAKSASSQNESLAQMQDDTQHPIRETSCTDGAAQNARSSPLAATFPPTSSKSTSTQSSGKRARHFLCIRLQSWCIICLCADCSSHDYGAHQCDNGNARKGNRWGRELIWEYNVVAAQKSNKHISAHTETTTQLVKNGQRQRRQIKTHCKQKA